MRRLFRRFGTNFVLQLDKLVLLDFKDVPMIGQAFADEIFRVFANQHAGVQLIPMHANAEIKRMIQRVTRTAINARHRAAAANRTTRRS